MHPMQIAINTDDQTPLKLLFARALLTEDGKSPMQKAQGIVGYDNPGLSLRMSQQWIADPIVVAEKDRLLDEYGEEAFMPTKFEFAAEVLSRARISEDKAAGTLYGLYAELRGWAAEKGTKINVDNSTKVVQIDSYGPNENWGNQAIEQQRTLQAQSAG